MLSYEEALALIKEHQGMWKVRELIALAQKLGWEQVPGGKGSHRNLKHLNGAIVPIPCHGLGSDLPKGLLHKILGDLLEPLRQRDAALAQDTAFNFKAWLSEQESQLKARMDQVLQDFATQAEERIHQRETEQLVAAEAALQSLLQDSRHEYQDLLQQRNSAVQVIEQQKQTIQEMQQRTSPALHQNKQQVQALTDELAQVRSHLSDQYQQNQRLTYQLEKTQSQQGRQQKQYQRLTLASGIAVAAFVGFAQAPAAIKGASVLLIPSITWVKNQGRKGARPGRDFA